MREADKQSSASPPLLTERPARDVTGMRRDEFLETHVTFLTKLEKAPVTWGETVPKLPIPAARPDIRW